jgi:thiosulfate dehydrogenase [quinone] large subunit
MAVRIEHGRLDLAGGPVVAGMGVAAGRLEQAVRRQHHLEALELGRPRLQPDRRRQHRLDPLRHRQDPDGQRTLQVGDAVAGFAKGALASGTKGDHPDIAYSWYVNWLEWLRDTGHTFFGPLVAIGEVVIGIALILGLFTGIMAFLGAVLNFSFVFAGSAGVNPAMILVSGLLILAWRNAGWYGLDRFVLPKLGTPWHRGEVFAPSTGSGTRVPT